MNVEKIVFAHLVRTGDVVFDVGANRGYYTVLLSHLVGRRGQVHAFEPLPLAFNNLTSAVSVVRKFGNVYLNCSAAGDANGTTQIYMPDSDDGQASIARHRHGSWGQAKGVSAFECRMTRLDDYIQSKAMERVDFVKCDIEGAELMALKGMRQSIERFQPILHLEICRHWTEGFQYRPGDIVEYLSERGYTDFYFVADSVSLLRDPASDVAQEESRNLLCTIASVHSHRLRSLKGSRYFAKASA